MSEKYILVTGASGGIGAEVCRGLMKKGHKPIVGFRSDETKAAALAKETGGIMLALDLAQDQSIDQAVEKLAAMTLAGVVHCASPAPKLAPFTRITQEEMEFFWRANVAGPHRLFAGLVRECFRKTKSGTVVAVTSRGMGDTLQDAMAGLGAYTVSKFGLYGVLALLASEYKWLKVATVKPGFTQTRMLEAFDPRFVEQLAATGAIADPKTIANDIVAYF